MLSKTTYRKPATSVITQLLTGLLVLYCYYMGLHKFLSFESYINWLQHRPQIEVLPQIFAWGVPSLHLLIALALSFIRSRTAGLYALILVQLLFFYWILWGRNTTNTISFPWYSWWNGPLNWAYKMWEAVVVAWLALAILILQGQSRKSDDKLSMINQ